MADETVPVTWEIKAGDKVHIGKGMESVVVWPRYHHDTAGIMGNKRMNYVPHDRLRAQMINGRVPTTRGWRSI